MSKTTFFLPKNFSLGSVLEDEEMGTGASDSGLQKSVSIPTWLVNMVKLLTPAVVALIMMYIHVAELRDHDKEHEAQIKELQSKNEDLEKKVIALEGDAKLEKNTNQGNFKNIAEAMVRVETGIRDIQKDVKELQKGR